ncbi:hypothetical protein LINPERPRIM_LOCUS33698 [Linum perenne]
MYELPTGVELAGLCRITSLNPLFDSLHFPLLFPYGNDGFHTKIRYNPTYVDPLQKRKYITQREYYCFRLQYRPDEGKTLIRSGKALQHFCIDAFTTIEQNRLTYLRLNHKKLRSDIYKGLNLGRIINPSSFTGSVRYMQQLYYDAMAIVQYHGNPDLFITSEDKPMLVARVFRMRLALLKEDLTKKCYFGRSIATELPDPTQDPVGYAAVTKFMLHGPCGESRASSPCMKENHCSKFFPKPYASVRTFDENGYVTYRRRATNISAVKSGVILNNAFVVPYNRDLVVKYQAHINVEVCHKGQLIKYLFKYIMKGPDRSECLQRIFLIHDRQHQQQLSRPSMRFLSTLIVVQYLRTRLFGAFSNSLFMNVLPQFFVCVFTYQMNIWLHMKNDNQFLPLLIDQILARLC